MSMIGIHYHCIRQMTLFMYSFDFKLSTGFFFADFPATVSIPTPIHGRKIKHFERQTYKQTDRQRNEKKMLLKSLTLFCF